MSITEQHILVVEDNPDDVLLVRRAFLKAGVANPLRVLSDGQQAIDYLTGRHAYADRSANPLPLLVLLDLKLPRKSGLEVLDALRQEPAVRRIPVVILTSSREEKDLHGAYDRGANSYLVKPVEFDALLELVRRLNLYWVLTNQGPGPATA